MSGPEDLDRAELKALLKRHWGLGGATLEYLPVGFGSHHWRAEDARGARRFVSVDDLEAGFQVGPDTDSAFAALDRAFRTAAALRDEAKLDFVAAPLADDPRGGVHLVDWDTTLIAPRERDLRVVLDRELTGWDEYAAVAGAATLNQEAIELYRRWWDLAEIGIYTRRFRRPHRRTEDTIKSWESLAGYLLRP